jgi:3-oxoacyl-[acyl-carrier-protein] synthase III
MSRPRPRIVGLGYELPEAIRTNNDPIFDWLKAHPPPGSDLFKGYDQRRVLAGDLASIMVPASRKALAQAGLEPTDVDLLLGWASIGPYQTPNELALVHKELGLPESAWVIPLANDFSNYNAGLLIVDGLIRAGQVRNALVAIGCDWTRYVSYQTPQSVSASDGAASAVLAVSDDHAAWEVVDHLTITRSDYYGTMFMRGDEVDLNPPQDGRGRLWTDPYFQITPEGLKGFQTFGVQAPPEAVLALLARHGLTGADVSVTSHQASTFLIDAWNKAIAPARYLNTIEIFANMTSATIPVNLAWAEEHEPISTSHMVLLAMGPDMHVNVLLLSRGGD